MGGPAARMAEMSNFLVGKSEGKRPHGKFKAKMGE
jgi:hypothetical protein